jgi:hypothetical protein
MGIEMPKNTDNSESKAEEGIARFRVGAPSQHTSNLWALTTGGRACTATAVLFAHRFLTLAQAGILNPDKDLCKAFLSEGIAQGVRLNRSIKGTFSLTSVHETLEFIKEYNNAHSTENNPFAELSELVDGESSLATTNPALFPREEGSENPSFMLESVLKDMLDDDSNDFTAVIATCAGHTTVIIHVDNRYYFINSATTLTKSTLDAFDNFDSLLDGLLETWGDKAEHVDLTALTREAPTAEADEAPTAEAGLAPNFP